MLHLRSPSHRPRALLFSTQGVDACPQADPCARASVVALDSCWWLGWNNRQGISGQGRTLVIGGLVANTPGLASPHFPQNFRY